jgi:hypothetical protein
VIDCKSIGVPIVSFLWFFIFVRDTSRDRVADRRVRLNLEAVVGISRRYFDRLGEKILNEF